MADSYRTKDGWVRAEHLRRGEIEQRGWRGDGDSWHIVRMRLLRKHPELWEVEHRIVHSKSGPPSLGVTLYNSLTEARRAMKQIIADPPARYEDPEVA